MNTETRIYLGLILILVGLLGYTIRIIHLFKEKDREEEDDKEEDENEKEEEEDINLEKSTPSIYNQPSVLPYWTVYGLPSYWPFYMSPYWYYDVPLHGPIQNPTHGYRRNLYRPHSSSPGYTGVATGGFGGGGHGGGGGKH